MRFFPFFALWLLSLVHTFAAGLEVKNPRWGFGGKPTLGTFNILSFEVRNTGAKPFDGMITLQQESGMNSAAPIQQQIYVAPGTSRWVQFTTYIGNSKPDFSLSWGGGREESFMPDDPRAERLAIPPAVVILADPDTMRNAQMMVFSEVLFPVTVSATDSLHAVVLDHVPRFQPPQAEAFLDWLRLGGIVHLVPGPTGELPKFEGALAPMNVAGNTGRVGAGLIVKHALPVVEMTHAKLETAGYPSPGEKTENMNHYERDSYDAAIFRNLAGVTKPKIAWWLIYLLTAVYVIVIGPVFFVIRKKDYRFLLAGFLGTVALFAWLFTVIGRRGYGENQVCHSLAVARVLGDGRFDVIHWSHAFATSGDLYRLAYPGSSHLYSALGGEGEKVRGSIGAGKDAFFDADIPLFSFRNFMHRGVMTGDDFGAKLESFDPNMKSGWQQKVQITLGTKLPGQVVRAALQVGTQFYVLKVAGDRLTMSTENSDSSALSGAGARGFDEYDYVSNRSSQDAIRRLYDFGTLLAQRSGGEPSRVRGYFGRSLRKDTARLYVYSSVPGAFRMAGSQFGTGQNFILYVQDFPLPPPQRAP